MVCHEGRVLIAQRRADAALGNYWEFPGGKVETGETPEQCVIRELREEMGITVRPIEALAPIDFNYTDKSVRLWPYLCTRLEGEARPLASQRIAWVNVCDLGQYRFPPANDSLLKTLAQRFPG
jgi:mutator protein MutT